MAEEPPDPEIEGLLADLRNDNEVRRFAAVEKLASLKPATDIVMNALKAAADQDPSRYVRQAALNALTALNVPQAELKSYTPLSAAAVYAKSPRTERQLTRKEKMTHFAAGLIGWFVIVGLLWFVSGQNTVIGILLFPINLIVLITLAFKRPWLALGMVSALALNALVAQILGVAVAGICFIPFFTPGMR
jgi:hypothetical protein